MNSGRLQLVLGLGLALLVVSASAAMSMKPAGAADRTVSLSAQVVSYDLAAGPDQRVLVGLFAGDAGLVAFGSVRFEFSYLGTKTNAVSPKKGPTATAVYKLVAGFSIENPPSQPRLFKPSQAIGVYAAEGVSFDRAGTWRVTVTVRFGDQSVRIPASFTVAPKHRVVTVGDPAPRTENALAGAAAVDARSLDSRADATTPVPDPELHSTTIAGALATGMPVMVVVSTPTYCTSQFCGPITDSLSVIAKEYAGRVAFVHLEVWKNFEKQQVNAAAAQWILPRGGKGDANEPWVFVVGSDGIVRQRFDNVAATADLEAATASLVS